MKPKVLLVEDEESLREMLTLNLEMENIEVESATNGEEGLIKFFERSYNLAILDVMLPEIDGYQLCRLIRQKDKKTPIMFLTAKNNSLDRVEGLKLGADDYLTKPFNLEEFLLRVNILIRRSTELFENSLSVFKFGGNSVDFQSYTAKNYLGENKVFSKKEFDLLKLLILKKNEVVSREIIIETVWEKDANPSPRTIDNFILNFRKAFEVNTKKPEFFQSIRGLGYKFSFEV